MPIVINPCALLDDNSSVTFNRKIIVLLIAAELSIFFILKIITLTCRGNAKSRLQQIIEKNKKERQHNLNMQHIQKHQIQQKSDLALKNRNILSIPKDERMAADKQITKNSDASESSQSDQNQTNAEESQLNQQRTSPINIKNLQLNPQELTDAVNYLIGQKYICWCFVFLYYPFMLISLICLLQFFILVTLIFVKICKKNVQVLKIISMTIIFLTNIVILMIGIYGLSARLPNKQGSECLGF